MTERLLLLVEGKDDVYVMGQPDKRFSGSFYLLST